MTSLEWIVTISRFFVIYCLFQIAKARVHQCYPQIRQWHTNMWLHPSTCLCHPWKYMTFWFIDCISCSHQWLLLLQRCTKLYLCTNTNTNTNTVYCITCSHEWLLLRSAEQSFSSLPAKTIHICPSGVDDHHHHDDGGGGDDDYDDDHDDPCAPLQQQDQNLQVTIWSC